LKFINRLGRNNLQNKYFIMEEIRTIIDENDHDASERNKETLFSYF
jgi:hypothetical protein